MYEHGDFAIPVAISFRSNLYQFVTVKSDFDVTLRGVEQFYYGISSFAFDFCTTNLERRR